jgi:hypothetical protein
MVEVEGAPDASRMNGVRTNANSPKSRVRRFLTGVCTVRTNHPKCVHKKMICILRL